METKGILQIAGKFPFVMLLTQLAINATVFIAINGPLLFFLYSGKRFATFIDVFADGVFQIWFDLLASGDFLSISVFLIVATMLVAVFFGGIQQGFILIIGWIISRVMVQVLRKPPLFVLPREYSTIGFPAFLSWLIKNPEKKIHWEWELFFHDLAWGVSINLALFSMLSMVLLINRSAVYNLISGLTISGIGLYAALTTTKRMANIHAFYAMQFEKEKLEYD